MNQRKTHIILWLVVFGSLSLLINGCVEPFYPVLDENEDLNELVVEGRVTNEPGSFVVHLSNMLALYNNSQSTENTFRPVTGADVQIHDDHGNMYLLIEHDPGIYESDDPYLKGVPGYSYTLLITTVEGKQYESSSVLMDEVPEIEELNYKEFTNTQFDLEVPYEENWLNVMVSTTAPGNETTYFKWEFEETWEYEMPGYVLVNHGNDVFSPPPTMESIVIENEKKHCWVTEQSSSILTKSTINSQSNEVRDFVIQSIGPPDDRLNIKYSILVKQYVINRKLHEFFNNVLEANVETGGIYGKTPSRIIGNIECCDGSEPAMGYFMASPVKSKRIYINPPEHQVAKGTAYNGCGWTSEIPRYLDVFLYGTYDNGASIAWSTNRYCSDCRVRGTHMKPDFWE
jgi:uncharacterized protein DUF4249